MTARKLTPAQLRRYGHEGDAIRAAPCVVMGLPGADPCVCRSAVIDDEHVLYRDPAHVVSVGADGGPWDQVSLCMVHHVEHHLIGIETFAAKYRLDLRALADAQALAHERPLGIRGLADRWAGGSCPYCRNQPGQDISDGIISDCGGCAGSARVARGSREYDEGIKAGLITPLVDFEAAALLGWVRRRMDAYVKGCADTDWLWSAGDVDDRAEMARWLALDLELGDRFELDAALALCKLAGGWPS